MYIGSSCPNTKAWVILAPYIQGNSAQGASAGGQAVISNDLLIVQFVKNRAHWDQGFFLSKGRQEKSVMTAWPQYLLTIEVWSEQWIVNSEQSLHLTTFETLSLKLETDHWQHWFALHLAPHSSREF